jgi:hypothetical protein
MSSLPQLSHTHTYTLPLSSKYAKTFSNKQAEFSLNEKNQPVLKEEF